MYTDRTSLHHFTLYTKLNFLCFASVAAITAFINYSYSTSSVFPCIKKEEVESGPWCEQYNADVFSSYKCKCHYRYDYIILHLYIFV